MQRVTAGDIDGRTKDFGMLLSFAEGALSFGKMAAKDFGYATKDVPRASCALGPTKTQQLAELLTKTARRLTRSSF